MLVRLIGEDIKLQTKLAPELGTVHSDPGQLQQAIVNLVVNSRDAMPKGGVLTIETENVELDPRELEPHTLTRPGKYVLLAVHDTGIGMDAATKARLFEPFFTTKEPGKGTGLGLATVYGIVIQTGGTITVASEPGRGSVFRIYLPRVRERIDRPEAARSPDAPVRGTEPVLLVEDE